MRRLRWLLVPILVVPIGWLLFTGFGRDPRAIASPLLGQPAPAWTMTTLDGETISTDELAGRPYVVNFWASWCGPCVDEHPILTAAHEGHRDELTLIGVLYQDAPADAEAFLARYGDAGYAHVHDASGSLAIDYGVTGPPETFFVDAEGIVRARQWGPLTSAFMDEKLATIGIGR